MLANCFEKLQNVQTLESNQVQSGNSKSTFHHHRIDLFPQNVYWRVCAWELFQGFLETFIHNLSLKLCGELSRTLSLGLCKCCHVKQVPLEGSVASSKKLKRCLDIVNNNASLVWQAINTLRFIWHEWGYFLSDSL